MLTPNEPFSADSPQKSRMSERVMAMRSLRPHWRRRSGFALPFLVAGGLCWLGWVWWQDRCYRDAITQIELEMANGRCATAARQLNTLLARATGSDEAAVLLGRCEKERGRIR